MGRRRIDVVGRAEQADHAALLGHPIHLLHHAREELERRPHHRQRHRRGTVGQRLQRRIVAVARTRHLGHRRHQRGHVEGVRDLLGFEHGQRGRRVGHAHHEDARAGADGDQRIAGAADMEQRHRHLNPRAGAEILGRRHVAGMRQHAAVGEHRALRKPGRARGVQLHEAVVGCGGVGHGIGFVRGQPGFVLVVGAADADHPLDRRHLIAQLVHGTGELGPDEQQPRLRVVDHVDDLGRRQPEVHHRVGGAHLRAGQRQLQARRVVEVEHGHPVARLQAGCPLGCGVAAHPARQLGPSAVGAGKTDGDGVGPLRGPVGQDRGEVGGLGHEVSCGGCAAPRRRCARDGRRSGDPAGAGKSLEDRHCGLMPAAVAFCCHSAMSRLSVRPKDSALSPTGIRVCS